MTESEREFWKRKWVQGAGCEVGADGDAAPGLGQTVTESMEEEKEEGRRSGGDGCGS